MQARGNVHTSVGRSTTGDTHPHDLANAPRATSRRTPRLTKLVGAYRARDVGPPRSCARSGGSRLGLTSLGQGADRGIPGATKSITVVGSLELPRGPRVFEPMGPTTPKVPPSARSGNPVGPRADPKLGVGEIRLARRLSNPDPSGPLPMLHIENRSREVLVSKINPELRDIVGGSIEDLRIDAHSNEPERSKVTVPDGPTTPGVPSHTT